MSLNQRLFATISTTKAHLSRLENLGVHTLKDLLLYFPRAYKDKTVYTRVAELRTDEVNNVQGYLNNLFHRRTRNGKFMTMALLSDETGSVEVVWFNQPYLQRVLKNGQEIILSGKARFSFGKVSLQSPSFENIKNEQTHVGRIVPVYHETDGISSQWLRMKIQPLLKEWASFFSEFLPESLLEQYQLLPYAKAIQIIHFPTTENELEQARKRLSFDELFVLQLKALQKKRYWQNIAKHEQKQIPAYPDLQDFLKRLPFELTEAQQKSLSEILSDLQKMYPMSRLLQGDVGSGKTVVAAIAMLNVVKAGYQTALMAPTEILAKQHYHTVYRLLHPYGFNIQFVAGSTPASLKEEIVLQLKTGTVDIVIGTHALIQETIGFKNLGLAVIDEQHRFGVKQRDILKSHGSPHLLSLSATPIPRTLAMTLYGDQDLSVIDQMPKGRQEIITRIVPEQKRINAYRWIEDRVEKGRQAFVICPLIDESDVLEVKSAVLEYAYLREHVFPHLKVGLLHGKMKPKEKEETMALFALNKINVLVSTSVIEVGIDVPNATIMIIEGAERFGLSQLHQFRGRVGRGEHQSYCFLFITRERSVNACNKSLAWAEQPEAKRNKKAAYQQIIPDNPKSVSEEGQNRLQAMVKHSSGFKLAEIDLQLRGPGEIYGVKQSGIPDLKMALLSDAVTIHLAREAAEKIIYEDPDLKKYPSLKSKVAELTEVFVND